MRIAAVSDDGKTISEHFGRAAYYVVLEVREGEIHAQERREKPGHHSFQHDHQHNHAHPAGEGHGMGAGAQSRHEAMIEVIRDCEVILARGMGRGAYQHLERAGIQPFVTDIVGIHEAVEAYLEGKLIDHSDRLH